MSIQTLKLIIHGASGRMGQALLRLAADADDLQVVAAVSGRTPAQRVVDGVPLLDLPYVEDSAAEVDMNIVCTGDGRLVEVPGTAEGEPFDRDQLAALVDLGQAGCATLATLQAQALQDER